MRGSFAWNHYLQTNKGAVFLVLRELFVMAVQYGGLQTPQQTAVAASCKERLVSSRTIPLQCRIGAGTFHCPSRLVPESGPPDVSYLPMLTDHSDFDEALILPCVFHPHFHSLLRHQFQKSLPPLD